MAWIKTIPIAEADQELLECLGESNKKYPIEYAVPVPSVLDPNNPAEHGAAIVLAHSLIPQALKHSFSTFGELMSPDLPLSRRDHELIAATVSALNDCFY